MCSSNEDFSSSSGDTMNFTSPSSQGKHSLFSTTDESSTSSPSPSSSSLSPIFFIGTSSTGDNILRRTELMPPGTARGCTDWYDVCTETLGFESIAEKMDVVNLEAECDMESASSGCTLPVRSKRSMERTSYPPVLSTLDENGRPRFSLEKVRSGDGRLKITMVERRTLPSIVRSYSDDGRVVMMWSPDGKDRDKDWNREGEEDDDD